MFKQTFPFGALLLLIAAILFVAPGCDREYITEPVDETIVDQPVDDGILTADEINAIGREQHKLFLENGGTLPQHAGDKSWQLYVNVPFYSQKDPRWKNTLLGFSTSTTIGTAGCFLTCTSMLYAHWGMYSMSPMVLNDWAKAHDGFSGALLIIDKAIDYPYNRNVWYITSSQIYSQLQAGRPVIVRVYWSGVPSHYMVIFAFDGQRFWVKDPLKDWTQQSQPLYGNLHSTRPLIVCGR